MKFLIDTHILIWHGENNPKLGTPILSIINDPANEMYVSHASLWEMAIKISIGKLKLGHTFRELEVLLMRNGFTLLPFDFIHYETLSTLPFFHNDPFDRMIIAQAISEKIEIITHDEKFRPYPVRIAWA